MVILHLFEMLLSLTLMSFGPQAVCHVSLYLFVSATRAITFYTIYDFFFKLNFWLGMCLSEIT